MAIGNLQVGVAKVCAANFSGNVRVGPGAILGFSAAVSGTASFYDDAATGTTNPLVLATVINTGWNPFPCAFSAGLNVVLTTAAGTVVLV